MFVGRFSRPPHHFRLVMLFSTPPPPHLGSGRDEGDCSRNQRGCRSGEGDGSRDQRGKCAMIAGNLFLCEEARSTRRQTTTLPRWIRFYSRFSFAEKKINKKQKNLEREGTTSINSENWKGHLQEQRGSLRRCLRTASFSTSPTSAVFVAGPRGVPPGGGGGFPHVFHAPQAQHRRLHVPVQPRLVHKVNMLRMYAERPTAERVEGQMN